MSSSKPLMLRTTRAGNENVLRIERTNNNTIQIGRKDTNSRPTTPTLGGLRGGQPRRFNRIITKPLEDEANENNDGKGSTVSLVKPKSVQLSVGYHDSRSSKDNVLVNIEKVPGAKPGDIAQLKATNGSKKKMYFIVKNFTSEVRRGTSDVSILTGTLQTLLDIPTRTPVSIKIRDKKEAELDLVELNIRDVYLSRGDMWGFSQLLTGQCLYESQKLTFIDSVRSSVNNIYRNGKRVFSGYVSENTKIIFRSESARMIFIIEITEEMWHFEENGEIMFHKLINNLFPKIFKKWKEVGTHHLITIVFSANVDFSDVPFRNLKQGQRQKNTKDYYRIVVDQVNIVHWTGIMNTLRSEFLLFTKEILTHKENECSSIQGRFSPSVKTNFLESINMAMTAVTDPFRDADLRHTVSHIILISAGTGLYDVNYDLLISTSKQLMALELSLDIICLTHAPLHIVPLFRYRDYEDKLCHCTPSWMSISYWNDLTSRSAAWFPRCRIYELQMMGVMENELNDVSIDYLKNGAASLVEFMDTYDKHAFVERVAEKKKQLRGSQSTFLSSMKDKKPLTSMDWRYPSTSLAHVDETTPTHIFADLQVNSESACNTLKSVGKAKSFSLLSKFKSAPPPTFSPHIVATEAEETESITSTVLSASRSTVTYREGPNSTPMKQLLIRNDVSLADVLNNYAWYFVENPSVPIDGSLASKMIAGKWRHVMPKSVQPRKNKWRSLSIPSELPVTTPMFPSVNEFETNYSYQNYQVVLSPEYELDGMKPFDLMTNMISMRLTMGFQICIGSRVEKVESTRSSNSSPEDIVKYVTKSNLTRARIYLIHDDEIHKIFCDDGSVITVQKYIRNIKEDLANSIPDYVPQIKTRYATEYTEAQMNVLSNARPSIKWNQYDHLLAGYADSYASDKLSTFRAKLVVLPADVPSSASWTNEVLTDEEIRVEGLRNLIALIHRNKFRPEAQKNIKSRKEEVLPEIKFYTGSLFHMLAQEDSLDTEIKASKELLSTSIPPALLAQKIQNGSTPLKLSNRKWRWKSYNNCFIGWEMVTWFLESFSDIDTRDQAVKFGEKLMQEGLFKHVENRHGFLDGHYFYQITPEFTSHEMNRKQSIASSKSGGRSRSGSLRGLSFMSPSVTRDSVPSSPVVDSPLKAAKEILLSTAVVLNLDPSKKSYKQEVCKVHHDKVHNPDHCFHIRLEWLTATPKLVDDAFSSWSRLCERYGLKLVEVPWQELCAVPQSRPFHSFVDIKLPINPWEDPEFKDDGIFADNKFYYQTHLLECSGFLLDNRATKMFHDNTDFEIVYSWGKRSFKYAQYIHKTGAYMAEIRDNGDLFLAPNNVHIARVNVGNVVGTTPKYVLDSQQIMLKFRATCLDYEKLRQVFLEAKQLWFDTREEFRE